MALVCVNGCQECNGCLWCMGGYESLEGRKGEGKGMTALAEGPAARQTAGVWRARAERGGAEALGQMLRQMDALRQEAERAGRRLEEARIAAANTGQAPSLLRGSRVQKQSKVEAGVMKCVELEEDLKELEEKLEPLVEQAREMIAGMEAGTRRTVARLRFLEGVSSAAIAWRLHYSRSYVYKALGEAMAEMAGSCNKGAGQRD